MNGNNNGKDQVTDGFSRENILKWKIAINNVFHGKTPTSTTWNRIDDIIRVLNTISAPNLNHWFFPNSGGLDLLSVSRSYEEGCIELHFSERSASIVKPKSLEFSYFAHLPSLSYFRLETMLIPAITSTSRAYEELCEIAPMEYKDREIWDSGIMGYDDDGNEIKIPDSSRVISRFLSGSHVVFAKGSHYNIGLKGEFDAYRAIHNKMSPEKFKEFITRLVEYLEKNNTDVES